MFHVDESTEAEATQFGKFLKAKAALLSQSTDVKSEKKKPRVWRIAARGHTSRSTVVNSHHHEQLCIIFSTTPSGAARPAGASHKSVRLNGVQPGESKETQAAHQ